MSLEAVDGRLVLVFHPAPVHIPLARGRDDRGVNDGAGLHRDRARFQLGSDRLEQDMVQFGHDGCSAEPDESRMLRRRLVRREPAETPKRGSIIKRLGEFHVRKVVPDRQ